MTTSNTKTDSASGREWEPTQEMERDCEVAFAKHQRVLGIYGRDRTHFEAFRKSYMDWRLAQTPKNAFEQVRKDFWTAYFSDPRNVVMIDPDTFRTAILEPYDSRAAACREAVREAKLNRNKIESLETENLQLRQRLIDPSQDHAETLTALRFVFSWLADICLFIETTHEYQNLKELQARAVCAHRQTLAYRKRFNLKTRAEVEKGVSDAAYENAPAAPCRTSERPKISSLLQEAPQNRGS